MELGNIMFGHSRGQYSFPDRDLADCTEWDALIHIIGADHYGISNKPCAEITNERGGYENSIFAINPYWWGDDENVEECERPNFFYKPTGLEIRWYKYPFRDSYMNQEITAEQLKNIWTHCAQSVAGQGVIDEQT